MKAHVANGVEHLDLRHLPVELRFFGVNDDKIPRTAEGVGTGYVSRSTFPYGGAKQAKSPQTSRHTSSFIDCSPPFFSSASHAKEASTLKFIFFNSSQKRASSIVARISCQINFSFKIGCCQSNSKESLYFSNLANYGIRHSCILSDGAKPVTE